MKVSALLVVLLQLHTLNCLEVLIVSLCYGGHIQPNSGAARALAARNMSVDVLMLDSCCREYSVKFRGIRSCYEAPSVAAPIQMVDESQLMFWAGLTELMGQNLTYFTYKETSKLLAKIKYDAVLYDWPAHGGLLAAQIRGVPALIYCIGPVFMSRSDNSVWNLDEDPFVFFHSKSLVPKFVQKFFNALTLFSFHITVSINVYTYMEQIFIENRMATDRLYLENTGFLGISYAHKNAIVISQGHFRQEILPSRLPQCSACRLRS